MVGTSNYFLICEYVSTNVITATHTHIETSRICNKFEDRFSLHMVNTESTELKKSEFNFSILLNKIRARGGAVGSGTALQAGRSRGLIPDGVIGIFH